MIIFLRLKDWQIFMLTFGIMMIIVLGQGLFAGLGSYTTDVGVLTFATTFSMLAASAWFYAIGTELHRRLPPEIQFNLLQFRAFIIIPAFYQLFSVIPGLQGNFSTSLTAIDTLFTFVSLGMGIANDITIAKALVSVETKRHVKFSEVVSEFFLLVFYPIGIWWIQPRLNRLVDDKPIHDPDAPLDSNLMR